MSDSIRGGGTTVPARFQPLPITLVTGRIPDVRPRPGPENPNDPSGRMQLIVSGLIAQVEQQSAQIAELQKALVQLQQHAADQQSTQIAELKTALGQLQQRAAQADQLFATHTHAQEYPALGYENIQVMTNPGKWDLATVIRKWTISHRETAPPTAPK